MPLWRPYAACLIQRWPISTTLEPVDKLEQLLRHCSCAGSSLRKPGCILIFSPGRRGKARTSGRRGVPVGARPLRIALLPDILDRWSPSTPASIRFGLRSPRNHLHGHVEAKRFVEGSRHQVIEPVTALRRTPSHDARLDTEALLGERMTIYETTEEGWAWGQLETDGYVGWLSSNALGAVGASANPQDRGPARICLSRPGHQAAASRRAADGRARRRHTAGRAVRRHGSRLACPRGLPGARSRCGSPISSPLRNSFSARLICGEARPRSGWTARAWSRFHCRPPASACPRDSDMQELALGKLSSLASLRRGDLAVLEGSRRHCD